jgi:predicted nucleotidyltransferase
MNEKKTREWIRKELEKRYKNALKRLILAGSRARGKNRANSDWDIIAVLEGYRSIWPVGPVRMHEKLKAPDDNTVEVFEVNPQDLEHPEVEKNQLIREALEYNIDL